jgi:hypothetical protein
MNVDDVVFRFLLKFVHMHMVFVVNFEVRKCMRLRENKVEMFEAFKMYLKILKTVRNELIFSYCNFLLYTV